MTDTTNLIDRLREVERGAGHSYAVEGRYSTPCQRVVPYGNMMNEAADLLATQAATIERLRGALEPFSKIVPSTLYSDDGSENEEYVVLIKGPYSNPSDITGSQLATARAAYKESGQ